MKKIIIIYICIMLLSTLVSSQLTISPNPINITSKVSETKSFQATFFNNYTFKIMDFEFLNFSNYGIVNQSISLNPGESKLVDFSIKPTKSFHGKIDSIIKFKYLIILPNEPQTHEVKISQYGFNPNFLILKQGDTVLWRNIDDISHTVTTSSFDNTIQPNQTLSKTFNNIEEIYYSDLVMFYSGTLKIINKSSDEKAHNPNYDVIWTINLESLLNPTNLEVVLLDQNFNIQATGQTEGSFKVKNIGNETAEAIKLSSDLNWIIFEKNNIDLLVGEQKYINYIIKPKIFSTNETNKSYNINIKVKASNSEEYLRTLNISIPYSNTFESMDTEEGFMVWFAEVYCPAHPNLFLCNTSVQNKGENVTIIRDPEFPINVSLVTWYEMRKDIQKLKDSGLRTDNQLKLLADLLGLSIPELTGMINQSVGMQKENEIKQNTRWDVIWILGSGTLILIAIVVIISMYIRKQNKEYLIEQPFLYRR